MKDENRRHALAPFLTSSAILAAALIALRYFYGKTFFVPFWMLAIVLALPLCLSWLAILFRTELRPPREKPPQKATAAPEPGTSPEPGAPAVPAGQKRRQKWRALVSRLWFLARRGVVTGYNKSREALRLLTSLGAIGFFSYRFFVLIGEKTDGYRMTFRYPVILTLLFVVFVILEKWVRHTETENRFTRALLHNVRSVMAVGRLLLLFLIVCTAMKALGFANLQRQLIWVAVAVYCYEAVFLLFSFFLRWLKKELSTAPVYTVPVPFLVGSDDDLSFVKYLEESTGITMRSLWSIKLIRHILPYTVIAVVMVFWLSTGLVKVESYQQGAVYRFGRLQEQTLSPGLHFVLPAPFDKVELYDTEIVNKVTIGYRSEEAGDNTWTAAHGGEEYKLLLGSGDEVVSINLRLEFKISNLHEYIKNSACAECVLEALAYELVTDRTISTDLDTLLSVDRAAFSNTFRDELTAKLESYHVGVEVVSVVLESIHPPVEIAETYQKLISAGIDAERYRLNAIGECATVIANAELTRTRTIEAARAAYFTKVAAANASVAEFMAAVEADNAYSDAYRYQKYLSAVSKAYGQAKIVIVGEDVNMKNLYFGSLTME